MLGRGWCLWGGRELPRAVSHTALWGYWQAFNLRRRCSNLCISPTESLPTRRTKWQLLAVLKTADPSQGHGGRAGCSTIDLGSGTLELDDIRFSFPLRAPLDGYSARYVGRGWVHPGMCALSLREHDGMRGLVGGRVLTVSEALCIHVQVGKTAVAFVFYLIRATIPWLFLSPGYASLGSCVLDKSISLQCFLSTGP